MAPCCRCHQFNQRNVFFFQEIFWNAFNWNTKEYLKLLLFLIPSLRAVVQLSDIIKVPRHCVYGIYFFQCKSLKFFRSVFFLEYCKHGLGKILPLQFYKINTWLGSSTNSGVKFFKASSDPKQFKYFHNSSET